jgi:hypothetical protein
MSEDKHETDRPAHDADDGRGISRRKALLTLGLAGLAAYAAPTVLGLNEAEARSWRRSHTSRHRRHRRRRRRHSYTSRHYRHNRWRRYHNHRRRDGFYLYIR